MKRFGKLTRGLAIAGATAAFMTASAVQAADTIKVGVLHSLSGTMAISETTLKDTVLMMVDDLNKKGGLLGKKVEAVVGAVLSAGRPETATEQPDASSRSTRRRRRSRRRGISAMR